MEKDNKYKMVVAYCYKKTNSYGFVHFLNKNTETGEYIDNTLGSSAMFYRYYIFDENKWLERHLKEDDIINPSELLDFLKEDFYEKYCEEEWRDVIKVEDM